MDFSALNPTDSHGVPILAYVLSFNKGSVVDPAPWGVSTIVDAMFALYKAIAWFALLLLNLVSSFDWLNPFISLLEQVSDSITGALGTAGIMGMAMAVAGAAAAVNWMRRHNHRTLYHLGLAALLIVIATAMVSPVRMAGQLLGLGRDLGAEVGAAATGTPHGTTLSQILADKLVREQTQRWNFGHDLDSLGCGQAWTDRILSGNADKVKDAAYACPGGTQLHDYAMNPTNSNALVDGFFALGCISVFIVFSLMLVVKLLRTGFATVLHATAIKPLMYLVPASPAMQNLFVRNALATGLGAAAIAVDILIYIVGASFTAGMAVVTGSGMVASVITALAMVGVAIGTRQFSKNIQHSRHAVAAKLTRSAGPAPRAPIKLPTAAIAGTLQASAPLLSAIHPALGPAVLAGAGLARGSLSSSIAALQQQPGRGRQIAPAHRAAAAAYTGGRAAPWGPQPTSQPRLMPTPGRQPTPAAFTPPAPAAFASAFAPVPTPAPSPDTPAARTPQGAAAAAAANIYSEIAAEFGPGPDTSRHHAAVIPQAPQASTTLRPSSSDPAPHGAESGSAPRGFRSRPRRPAPASESARFRPTPSESPEVGAEASQAASRTAAHIHLQRPAGQS
ncbi:hypothetical protein JF729_18310 [Mycobacterium intracellulare]|uniref:hypothetical protein n=1 Tax=Mycobacterium intracellulare TaxID=1767 RepID=UPI001CDA3AB2|nr:hypothetical protein [Mycobacterium intracellulare]MCA2249733.1 hypothetical protein [Mycobacterium intracellulare]